VRAAPIAMRSIHAADTTAQHSHIRATPIDARAAVRQESRNMPASTIRRAA